MRIACDLDGTLADMSAALAREAERLFGKSFSGFGRPGPRDDVSPSTGEGSDTVERTVEDEEPNAKTHEADAAPHAPHAAEAGAGVDDAPGPPLTMAQQRRLWKHVRHLENFWLTLSEIEPGAVARLGVATVERRWEVIFLTQRPPSSGETAQVQSQRWLEAHGFEYPSVYVIGAESRGRVADALQLDVVIDDRPENCLDVSLESRALPILVWRDDPALLPEGVGRHGIEIVRTVSQALAVVTRMQDERRAARGRLKASVRRSLGALF